MHPIGALFSWYRQSRHSLTPAGQSRQQQHPAHFRGRVQVGVYAFIYVLGGMV